MYKQNSFALFLTILLFTTGCSSKTEINTDVSADPIPETTMQKTETELRDNVPDDVRFADMTFFMLSPSDYDGQCLRDELSGDALNDTIYEMEISVEERLGVTIEEKLTEF